MYFDDEWRKEFHEHTQHWIDKWAEEARARAERGSATREDVEALVDLVEAFHNAVEEWMEWRESDFVKARQAFLALTRLLRRALAGEPLMPESVRDAVKDVCGTFGWDPDAYVRRQLDFHRPAVARQ
jgi:hypothetical protein